MLAEHPLECREHDLHQPPFAVPCLLFPFFPQALFLIIWHLPHAAVGISAKLFPDCHPPRIAGTFPTPARVYPDLDARLHTAIPACGHVVSGCVGGIPIQAAPRVGRPCAGILHLTCPCHNLQGLIEQRNEHRRIPGPVAGDLDCQYLLCVHIHHHVELDKPSSDLLLVSDPLPPVVLLQTGRVYCETDRRRPAACDGKHAAAPFDIQCLKPSVYGCVAGRILVTECLNQHSLQVPVRQPCHRFYHRQGRKQRLGVLERRTHLVPVCACHLLISLRIVPDDQRLTTLDVFLVVSHRQSVSDLLIFSFFGL